MKQTYKYLSYASLGLLGFALYKLYKETKKPTEAKSGFSGVSDEQIMFMLTNNTKTPQTAYLFNGYNNQNNPNVGVVGNLAFFNRELTNQPKVVKKIEFRAMGASATNQAEAPFKMNCLDANGNSVTNQYLPMVSPNQYQGGITSVDMNDLILNGECYMEYTVNPNSRVNVVVYYNEQNN